MTRDEYLERLAATYRRWLDLQTEATANELGRAIKRARLTERELKTVRRIATSEHRTNEGTSTEALDLTNGGDRLPQLF